MAKHTWSGGAPPEGHPRRCRVKFANGDQCPQWAMKRTIPIYGEGKGLCYKHGGRQAKAKNRIRNGVQTTMPQFYSHKLNRTLSEYVDQQLGSDTSEQLNLLQELALMRSVACDAVTLYSAACETANQEVIANAGIIMSDALKNVAEMAEKATRVEKIREDQLDGVVLRTVLDQVVRVAFEAFEGDKRAQLFENLIREKIKVPGGIKAAEETPDDLVRQMMENTVGIEHGIPASSMDTIEVSPEAVSSPGDNE